MYRVMYKLNNTMSCGQLREESVPEDDFKKCRSFLAGFFSLVFVNLSHISAPLQFLWGPVSLFIAWGGGGGGEGEWVGADDLWGSHSFLKNEGGGGRISRN